MLRVQGWTGKIEDLIGEFEQVRGAKYQITWVDTKDAQEWEEQTRVKEDDWLEMQYSIKPLLAGGYGIADGVGKLDNDMFDFKPETPKETSERALRASNL